MLPEISKFCSEMGGKVNVSLTRNSQKLILGSRLPWGTLNRGSKDAANFEQRANVIMGGKQPF